MINKNSFEKAMGSICSTFFSNSIILSLAYIFFKIFKISYVKIDAFLFFGALSLALGILTIVFMFLYFWITDG